MKEEAYMRLAIQLAQQGRHAAPNPRVGAVIVWKDQIIGTGYHKQYGKAHAEINALDSVPNELIDKLAESEIYVTLEPCNHTGQTGPCTEALIRSGIKRVIIGATDPNPDVQGAGAEHLRAKGMKVQTGILTKECQHLLQNFQAYGVEKRPYVFLKYAVSQDGYFAPKEGRAWLSSKTSQYLVHKWRSEYQAIMIATETAIVDNPRLNVRKYQGENPIRIVLDRQGRLPSDLHLWDGSQRTIVISCRKEYPHGNMELIPIDSDQWNLKNIMSNLWESGFFRIMVEGGNQLIKSFLDEALWDQCAVIRTTTELKDGIKAHLPQQALSNSQYIGNDQIEFFHRS